MMNRFRAGLFASFTGIVIACGGTTVEQLPEQAATVPPTETPAQKVPEAGPRPDVEVKAPVKCEAPSADPQCATTKPAPTSSAAIDSFFKEAAIPLRCGSGGSTSWDLRALVERYGAQKIFMMGEVHGTNEIGIMSSLLVEELASKGLVNVIGFEIPMDYEPFIQSYVDGRTSLGPISSMAKNFFGRILSETARRLAEKGVKIRMAAVDIPVGIELPVDAITTLAQKLVTHKASVTSTLPTSIGDPPSQADIQKVNAYFDHIMAEKTAICTELTEAECDRLVAMTHALWSAALAYDQDGADSDLWFERREEVIYYNMHSAMPAATDRMFLHMGAAHTNKYAASGGSRMAKEYPLTKGQVFSVAPAWGNGSVIEYGGEMALDADPASITRALTDEPAHPLFISTTRPSVSCEKNPLQFEQEERFGSARSDLYDGYIHYGKLTPETRPGATTFERDVDEAGEDESAGTRALGIALRQFRARVEKKEVAAARAIAEKRANLALPR